MKRLGSLAPAIVALGVVACGTSSQQPARSTVGAVAFSADASALASGGVTGVWVQLTPVATGSTIQGWLSPASGKWSTTFENVPAATYDIYAKAVNGSGQILYQTPTPFPGGPVTVSGGGLTTVALVLQGPSTNTSYSAPVVTSLFANQTQVATGAVVQLSASASEPDPTDPITFAWSASGGTLGSVASAATTSSTTWTPPGTGAFTITLKVTDSHGLSSQESINITVGTSPSTGGVVISMTLNDPPVVVSITSTDAQAVPAQALPLSAVATDPDGDPIAFSWSANCPGTFASPVSAPDPQGSRSTTAFTPTSVPNGNVCTISLQVADGLGGVTTAQVAVSFVTPVLGADPTFTFQVSPIAIGPGQQSEATVVANDGAAHPTWSYAFSDGLTVPQAGTFSPKASGNPADVLYVPAYCELLGSGAIPVTLSVTVTDSATRLANSTSIPITVQCPAAVPNLTTETLYQPQQDPSTYEAAPAGFSPVYTELLARHGARGMSSEGSDIVVYNMWLKAQSDGALTPLGRQLGPDVLTFIQANTVLGAGVSGITAPGYGNLTQTGAQEHQSLATRMLQRLPAYFAQVAAQGRQIVVQTSGVNRAYDSSGYFTRSLVAGNAALSSLVNYPPAITGYGTKPKAQLPGTNRFLLYFHKLSAAQDQVTSASDPYYATYQASLAYQTFKASDPVQTAKVNAINAIPDANAAAQLILQQLFTQAFINKLGTTGYTFADTGTFTVTGVDGKSYTTTGSGTTTINSALDAANNLYAIYIIVPAMHAELGGMDFTKYLPDAQAAVFDYLGDATDFYQMGPGAREDSNATYGMAQVLLNDFFNEVDAIVKGTLTNGAKLRFAHAEIVTPFASILGLKNIFFQLPAAETYTYAATSAWNADLTSPTASPWRDEVDAPMAANVQWDVYADGGGHFIVKMMLNEQEIDFSAACDGARHAPGSHFYDYTGLKACYGHVSQ